MASPHTPPATASSAIHLESVSHAAGQWLLERAAVLAFLLLWELLPRIGGLFETFIAPPSVVLRIFWEILRSGELAQHVGVSALRAVDPILHFFGQLNPFSLFPLFVIFFGIGEVSKSVMVFWVCLWPLLFHTVAGVKEIDPLLVKAGRTMGCDTLRLFFKVIVPAASPGIFAGLRSAASTAFFMLVAAEMIGASAGLGWLVWNAQVNFQIPRLFTATVVISILGLTLNALLARTERRVVGWKSAWNTAP